MSENTLILLSTLLIIAIYSFLIGRFIELSKTTNRISDSIRRLESERRALTNRLFAREGVSPIEYDADGSALPQADTGSDSPNQILRPPFAQAELDWEAEDETIRPLSMRDITEPSIPPLTERQKQELTNRIRAMNHPDHIK